MLEKMAMVGSDRRRNEWPPALTQGLMLSIISAANPVRALRRHTLSSSRDFLARFLLDTQCPSGCRSTRHSDTSRNQRNFFNLIKTACATRHLNATLATRQSNAKFRPVSPSLFFPSGMASGGTACGTEHRTLLRDDFVFPQGESEGSEGMRFRAITAPLRIYRARARRKELARKKVEKRYEMRAVGLVTAMRRTSDLEKPASSIF